MASFYEFFAGGGMARAGLGPNWQCLFANDFSQKKAASYISNWGTDHLRVCDVAVLTTNDLPAKADLAWASFPCQDLSLAGTGAGLKGNRSGTFWSFWELIKALSNENRAPRLVVLENVCGTLSSHDGKDFCAIGSALSNTGYQFGAVVINAIHFLPQSRPRLFIVGIHKFSPIPSVLVADCPEIGWHPPALIEAYCKLPKNVQNSWKWWRLPIPPARTSIFADLLENESHDVVWHTTVETKKLLDLMDMRNSSKVAAVQKTGSRQVGTIYKRTRADGSNGKRVQRAEIRFDGVAGCLRTPIGGSSRQIIMVIEGKNVRSRLLAPREAARLMGLQDTYTLPDNYNDAYHLVGDGVAVPVVRFLAKHILEPLLAAAFAVEKAAA
jgi:DNA (cytosine-5)-methyltransferase 1